MSSGARPPVKHLPFDTGSRLSPVAASDRIRLPFHEFRKFILRALMATRAKSGQGGRGMDSPDSSREAASV